MKQYQAFEIVKRPVDSNVAGSHWAIKIKYNAEAQLGRPELRANKEKGLVENMYPSDDNKYTKHITSGANPI